MSDATTTARKVEHLLAKARFERMHGNRPRAEAFYEQVIALPGLEEAAPLMYHEAFSQGGNAARLNRNFDRSNVLHLQANDLFARLLASDKLSPEDKQRLILSQVHNLRNHAEEIRLVAAEASGQAGRNPLRESLLMLDESLRLIKEHDLGWDEEAASCMFRGRAMISIFGPQQLVQNGLSRARLMLIESAHKPHNPYYRLYCELDVVEVACYNGKARGEIFTAFPNLYTSLRYGNLWPPKHFGRAVFNLAMCCTPLLLRWKILRRYGRLISTIPAKTVY